jgi:hypothetical protein
MFLVFVLVMSFYVLTVNYTEQLAAVPVAVCYRVDMQMTRYVHAFTRSEFYAPMLLSLYSYMYMYAMYVLNISNSLSHGYRVNVLTVIVVYLFMFAFYYIGLIVCPSVIEVQFYVCVWKKLYSNTVRKIHILNCGLYFGSKLVNRNFVFDNG